MTRTRPLAVVTALLLFVALAAIGCSKSKPADPTPSPVTPVASPTASASPTPGPSPTPTATPRPVEGTRPFPADLQERADEILAELGDVRDEPAQREIGMFLLSRDAAITAIENEYDEEARADFALTDDVYSLLGLIPEESDTLSTLLSLLQLGVLGFYSPDQQSFYLVDDVESTWESTIIHEFAHALQDQYHDLLALDEQREEDWDALQAVTTVHEGDAVATEWALQGDAVRSQPDCFEIPPDLSFGFPYAVYRELNSWYDDGYCFVNEVFPDQPGRIYENLPATMEQILHPEKYRVGEGAKPVTLESLQAALGSGWEETDSSTLGEFTWQNILLLGLWDDPGRVQDAAAGWGGDRWGLYEANDGALLIHVELVMDSDAEAGEFWDAFVASLNDRSDGSLDANSEDETLFWDDGGKRLYADIAGDTVTIVISGDQAAAEAAAAALGLD